METDEKARVAVLSRGLASAAAEGWRTPPARDTGTGLVGLASACDWAAAEVTAAEDEAEDSTALVVEALPTIDDDDDAALVAIASSEEVEDAAPRVIVTKVIEQADSTEVEGART